MSAPAGHLCPVLHAHLPYVRHPELDDPLEEDWLFEAISETYLPLLDRFTRWTKDGLPWRLTMTVSPTLAAMLEDPLLQKRYRRHVGNLLALLEKEQKRLEWQPEYRRVAEMYVARLMRCREAFERDWQGNLLHGFRKFHDLGHLELLACAATHALLPLAHYPKAVEVQLEVGCREFERHFGHRPHGIWLPECGYHPSMNDALKNAGLRYFHLDAHGVAYAEPRPRYGVYSPILAPDHDLIAVGRDVEVARQVWSSIEGYPGDPAYREFHRDIGFQLDLEYLKPHLHSLGVRHFTGLKYERVTGRTEAKQVYDPESALLKAEEHAEDFYQSRIRQTQWLREAMPDRPPLLVCPFDAELFGHWWYEGPDWLDFLVRRCCLPASPIALSTVPSFLAEQRWVQRCQPAFSTWGEGGYCGFWLNETNDWIYPPLHGLMERFGELVAAIDIPGKERERAMNQALREILLAQSSDWAFLMKAGTMAEYAAGRVRTHLDNAYDLIQEVERDRVDMEKLKVLEDRNPIFKDLNYRLFR